PWLPPLPSVVHWQRYPRLRPQNLLTTIQSSTRHGGGHGEHPVYPVEYLHAWVPRLIGLLEQQIDVFLDLLRSPERLLDAVHQLVTRISVLADALHQHGDIAFLSRCHHFLLSHQV